MSSDGYTFAFLLVINSFLGLYLLPKLYRNSQKKHIILFSIFSLIIQAIFLAYTNSLGYAIAVSFMMTVICNFSGGHLGKKSMGNLKN
jgi:hypothetical protein